MLVHGSLEVNTSQKMPFEVSFSHELCDLMYLRTLIYSTYLQHLKLVHQRSNTIFAHLYRIVGYFRGGNISRMPSGAIIHEENFHECMAVTNTATLTSAISQGNFSRIKLNSRNS